MGSGFSRSLAEAAVSGDCQRLDDLLLSSDAKRLRAADADGWTALHFAAAAGDAAAVALLLSHEEDGNGRSATARRAKDGSTPLHLAASTGSSAAVVELLKAGAEADALDGKGRSPLVVAAASPKEEAGVPEGSSSDFNSGAVVSALVAAGADAKRALPVSDFVLLERRGKSKGPLLLLLLLLFLFLTPSLSFLLILLFLSVQNRNQKTKSTTRTAPPLSTSRRSEATPRP